MGSRGSEYNDDGIKKTKSISKAEQRIEAEETKFPNMPGRGLAESLYKDRAQKAIDIMHKAKNIEILNDRLDISVTQQENFIRKLINGELKQSNGKPIADGGLFVSENSTQMDDYIANVLGYSDKSTVGNIISDMIQKNDIFNMKNSDKYFVKIGNKMEAGQIYEFNLNVPDINGVMHDSYVKIINVHGKNGEIYSIIDSIHAPKRTVSPIWVN